MQSPELKLAIAAARAAGEILRDGFGRSHEIDFKGPIDIVTEIDRASEDCLVEFLRREMPGSAFLTEERPRPGAGPHLWLIDPLDGRVNYARGYPSCCVSSPLKARGYWNWVSSTIRCVTSFLPRSAGLERISTEERSRSRPKIRLDVRC
jgi:fructose-1,6-bisphosphatase/inositol monophosphatase family enzyme